MSTTAATGATSELPREVEVPLPDGPRLAVRLTDGPLRPFLLVHGLASNARLWDGTGRRLADAGHTVAAVDLRGHGRSEAPAAGYDTDTCADDLATLADELGFTGGRAPVVVGQSWGGNVVLSLAARRGGVAAVGCVDGGWSRPGQRFASFEACWAELAPPTFEGWTYADLRDRITAAHPDWPAEGIAGTLENLRELPGGGVTNRLAREHHREILRSMYLGDPRAWYPLVRVPVLLCPAIAPDGAPDRGGRAARRRADVTEAASMLPNARVSWYVGADHDLHAQHPGRLAADLLALAAAAEPDADLEAGLEAGPEAGG
jgi:pimeloyl-ACP methyl ester carboxylesterase